MTRPKSDANWVSSCIIGIMALWFLVFLLEHLSLFGKGTPQHQVSFGSTGGRSVCVGVWESARWNSSRGGSDHTDRGGEWQTIPAVKFPYISLICIHRSCLPRTANCRTTPAGSFSAPPLLVWLLQLTTQTFFISFSKMFAIFYSLFKLCVRSQGVSWQHLWDR